MSAVPMLAPIPVVSALDPTSAAVVRYDSAACTELDPTSKAVLRYLLTDDRQDKDARYDAFVEVVAICYAAMRGSKKVKAKSWQRHRLFLTEEKILHETNNQGKHLRWIGGVGATT